MPTYEYRCTTCGSEFERFQKISEAPIRECPECDGRVERLISSGGGLLFRGSGFYATDYRSGAAGGASSEKATPKEKGSGETPKSGGKSDAAAGEAG